MILSARVPEGREGEVDVSCGRAVDICVRMHAAPFGTTG